MIPTLVIVALLRSSSESSNGELVSDEEEEEQHGSGNLTFNYVNREELIIYFSGILQEKYLTIGISQ